MRSKVKNLNLWNKKFAWLPKKCTSTFEGGYVDYWIWLEKYEHNPIVESVLSTKTRFDKAIEFGKKLERFQKGKEENPWINFSGNIGYFYGITTK